MKNIDSVHFSYVLIGFYIVLYVNIFAKILAK